MSQAAIDTLERHKANHDLTKEQLASVNRHIEQLRAALPEDAPTPPLAEIANQSVLRDAEYEAHKLIAAKELEEVIENTEGDNNDPSTILTAIESLRA